MGYQNFGLDPGLVERVKTKMKNPETKERVKMILNGVTKKRFAGQGKGEKVCQPFDQSAWGKK